MHPWKSVHTAPSGGPVPIGEVLAEILARLPPPAVPGDRPRGRGRADAIANDPRSRAGAPAADRPAPPVLRQKFLLKP